jgi:hypothetical protein
MEGRRPRRVGAAPTHVPTSPPIARGSSGHTPSGSHVLAEGFGGTLFGTGGVRGDLFDAAGRVIDRAVAEWVIRRPQVSARARLVGVPS